MTKSNNLIIIDYSCHPFSLDLAYNLANKKINVHYIFSKNINLTGNFYKSFQNKNLKFHSIDVKNIPKHEFMKRRSKEIEFGKKTIKKISKLNSYKVILANLPIDPLYDLIRFCKKKNIDSYFWIQDIYYLAIKNVLKKNIFFYFFFGYLIYKFYSYLEKYCFLNSTKNILITKKFLNSFPKRKNNYVIENWIPISKSQTSKKKYNYILNKIDKKKFTFIYTGTLSYKHHSENLLQIASRDRNCNIIILSNDKFAKDLYLIAKKKNINNIYLFKLVSYNDLEHFFKFADVGIVNLSDESSDLCVPSKVLTYYKFGIPVLGSMPSNNLASKNIKKYKTGLVSNPNDIKKNIKYSMILKKNHKLRKIFSKNGSNFAKKKFNIEKISQKFIKILNF